MKNKFLPLAASFALLLLTPDMAQAQGYPLWYFGQSLLYPLTRGLTGALLYGPYNANPLYSGSFFMKRAASNAIQWPYIYGYNPSAYGPTGYRNLGMPANYNYGLSNQDMTNPPPDDSLYTQGGQANLPQAYQQPPLHLPDQPYSQPQFLPQGQNPGQPVPIYDPGVAGQTPMAVNRGKPVPAPQVLKGKKKRKQEEAPAPSPVPTTATSDGFAPNLMGQTGPGGGALTASATQNYMTSPAVSQVPGGANPLAQGFIDHLNSKYDGDISKALASPDTRSWAKAMGLTAEGQDGSTLSKERLDVISKVLKDSSLDPVSKLDTLRILLRKN